MSLYVGTSGWAYKEWKDGFYPPDLPQSRFLEYYGTALTACEVNATFYRLQAASTFEKWVACVPEEFRFAIKAHRRITHRKQFAPVGDFLETFLQSLEPLGKHLACVLFQFPPFVERDDEQLDGLLEALPQKLRFACEFRDESWGSPEIEQRIAEAGGTVCVAETNGSVSEGLPPGPLAYIRLRSPKYNEAPRQGWLELLKRESEQRDVYAFAKHEGLPAGDPYAGVGLAQWLVAGSGRRS